MLLRAKSLAISSFIAALLASPAIAAFQNDFSGYPVGSQQCLSDAADGSGCNGDTVQAMNSCLCGNGGDFVLKAAICIGKKDSGDLDTVYTTLSIHCSDSKTPLSVNQDDFNAAATSTSTSATTTKSKTSTSTQATNTHTTTTTTSSSSSASATTLTTVSSGHTITVTQTQAQPTETGSGDGGDNKEGLSHPARIAIIACSAVAGIAVLAALGWFFLRYRRGRNGGARDEAHPMLPQSSQPYFGGAGADISGRLSASHMAADQDPHKKDWNKSPGGLSGRESYPYAPDDFNNYAHQYGQPGVYELADSGPDLSRPVEMPATPMHVPAGPLQGGGENTGWGPGPYDAHHNR